VPAVTVLRGRLDSSFASRCAISFVSLQGLDRAMVIASQAFTAVIPLLILLSAVLPAGGSSAVSDTLIRRFGLSGEAAVSVELMFEDSAATSIGLGSLLLLVFSGVTLAGRLQRMYVQAWQLEPPKGVRASVNAALGLGALLAEIAILYLLRAVARALPFDRLPFDWVVSTPLSIAASLFIWTSIPWLLLDRRVGWRRLLPAGALTGTLIAVYGVATTLYMPRLFENYSEQYGLFGVTIALVGWLLCISLILVVATVVAAELDRAPEPWARRLRTRLDGDRAAPGALVGSPDEGGDRP
jgi:membrane protein